MDDDYPTSAAVTDYLGELFRYEIFTGMTDLSARQLMLAQLNDFKPVLPPEEYQELGRKIAGAQPPFYFSRINTVDMEYIPPSTYWLARTLWMNPWARFDDFREECMTHFNIGSGVYKFKTWPDARDLAGLGEAKAGRPSKSHKKESVTD